MRQHKHALLSFILNAGRALLLVVLELAATTSAARPVYAAIAHSYDSLSIVKDSVISMITQRYYRSVKLDTSLTAEQIADNLDPLVTTCRTMTTFNLCPVFRTMMSVLAFNIRY